MATSQGGIQGDTGVATVDAAPQIVVDAQAHGVGAEQELLLQAVSATASLRMLETLLTADAGYHSEANRRALAEAQGPALIAEGNMRTRAARFAAQARYTTVPNPLHDQSKPTRAPLTVFGPKDFPYDPVARTCVCPAGKTRYRKGAQHITRNHIGEHFRGAKRDGSPCALRAPGWRTPDTTPVRNVAFFQGRVSTQRVNHSALMRDRLDTPEGRAPYAQRFATVEPVFANLRANKRLDRFPRRGRVKVDTQWKLYGRVHNIEQLAHAGSVA